MSYPIYEQPNLDDVGTDDPTRTLEQTQSTPSANINEADANAWGSEDSATYTGPGAFGFAASSSGKGAPNDDNSSGPNTTAGTREIINAAYNQEVKPQPNVLDQYASYTYNLAWYLITPEIFESLSDGPPNINQWVLIARSGGADAQTDANGNGKRSPFFPIDYYMDNLTIESGLVGSGPGSQMATAGAPVFNFQVTEPSGLTLPGALAGAVKDYYGKEGLTKASPVNAFFCMVIQFYGYDINGNLVEAGKAGNQNGSSSAASPRAIVQKIYPFTIKEFNFKLVSGVVVYDIIGISPQYNFNLGTMRGMIPAQFELVGDTVGAILSGTGDAASVIAVDDGRLETPTVKTPPGPPKDSPAIAAGNSRDGIVTSLFSGGSINTETGGVGYGFGA